MYLNEKQNNSLGSSIVGTLAFLNTEKHFHTKGVLLKMVFPSQLN